jgi:hypothetical protein
LAPRLGRKREAFHDLRERAGIALGDAGRGVNCATDAEPDGKALGLAQRVPSVRRARAWRTSPRGARPSGRVVFRTLFRRTR